MQPDRESASHQQTHPAASDEAEQVRRSRSGQDCWKSRSRYVSRRSHGLYSGDVSRRPRPHDRWLATSVSRVGLANAVVVVALVPVVAVIARVGHLALRILVVRLANTPGARLAGSCATAVAVQPTKAARTANAQVGSTAPPGMDRPQTGLDESKISKLLRLRRDQSPKASKTKPNACGTPPSVGWLGPRVQASTNQRDAARSQVRERERRMSHTTPSACRTFRRVVDRSARPTPGYG